MTQLFSRSISNREPGAAPRAQMNESIRICRAHRDAPGIPHGSLDQQSAAAVKRQVF
jgi:hypothetical protein